MQDQEKLIPECIAVDARSEAKASVIWLHGLGADSHDFVGVVDRLGKPLQDYVRFIFPAAPMRNITVNQGMRMRGWYDIYGLTLNEKEDRAGILDSKQMIARLVEQEIEAGISEDKIVLAGFSQGGAIALITGCWGGFQLGGIIGLSTYVPLLSEWPENVAKDLPPIFLGHGYFTPSSPITWDKIHARP